MVPAALSLHFVRAWARDCSTGMVVIPVPPPSAMSVGSKGSGARLPKSSRASSGGSSRAPALRAYYSLLFSPWRAASAARRRPSA